LWVCTGRTFKRRFESLDNTTALPAFPKGFLGLLEEALVLQRLGQPIVPSFVPFFDGGDLLERLCYILEAFLIGVFSRAPVKSRPFKSFAGGSRSQLSQSVAVNARR